MSKNMTRKGLALGAGVALISSSFGILPASAAGQDDKTLVSLTPRTGTEYTVLLDQYFDLKSNVVGSLQGTADKDVKFLVSDPSSLVFVDQSNSSTDSTQIAAPIAGVRDSAGNDDFIVTDAGEFVNAKEYFVFGAVGTDAAKFNGKVLTGEASTNTAFIDASPAEDAAVNGDAVVAATLDTQPTVEIVDGLASRDALIANAAIDTDLFESATVTSQPGKTTTNGRASDGTFVINTETNSNSNDRLLRLVTNSTSTYSVTVTAWVDDNDNGLIDSTEYTSPERTVTFQKPADLTFGYTFAPTVGDENLELKFSTTPVLNGQQVDAQDASSVFGALFTRQDSSDSDNYATDANSTWDDTDKLWTSKVSMDLATQAWTDLTQAVQATPSGITHADGVATATVAAGHNLRVGDVIDFGNSITSTVAATQTSLRGDTFKVTGVTSTTVFTFAASGASTIGGTLTYDVVTYTGNDAITDRVFPGTHTAQPYVGTTKLGAKQTAIVGSSSSDDSTLEIVGTSTIQPGKFTAVADANNVEVKKGVTSVPVTVTVVDSSDVAVSAGRNVAISLGNPNEGTQAGTFKINGSTAPVTLTTDANGQVSFTVEENDGDVAAQVRVTATPENLTAAASSVDLIWNDSTYALYDLNDPSTSRQEKRTIAKNGTVNFEFALLDQWKAGPADGTYRLKVDNAGNTVSSAYHSVVGGRANVAVTDGQIGAGSAIDTDVTVEKDVSGTWTAQTSISWNSDGGALGDLAISVLDQTDKVVLDADGSTLYGNDTADLADDLAAKATEAQDRRTSIATGPSYTNSVVVSGRVVNAVTNAARPGAVVTLSGPSSILFSEGGVDSFGSITLIADTNGEFGVDLYSTTAQKDSVITVTSGGVSSTVKVTFNAAAATAGATVAIDAPAAVNPGSTFQVTATVSDKYGNPVSTGTNDQLKVTYTGPGIVFGTLPDDTDVNGQISFAVLLGANDTGAATVTVSYDQSDDGDFTGTTTADADVTVSKSITVGSTYGSMTAWTKDMGDGTAKVYIKFPTIGEKVRIGHQTGGSGSYETIYVKTLDSESHPDLTVNANGSYIVRTIDLVDGTNRIRVTVGDTTEVQVRYNE